MRVFRYPKQVTIFIGPWGTSFQWSRTATFGANMDSRVQKHVAKWWSGISRWRE